MTERLTPAEVERLIDTLDRTAPEQTAWRPACERLRRDFIRGKRVQNAGRHALRFLFIGVLLFLGMRLYAAQWDLEEILPELPLAIVAINLLDLLYQFIASRFFPTLRREERVAALLRHFGADIPDQDSWHTPRRPPPEIEVALETLEKAKSPVGLRHAYESVEKWQNAPEQWTIDSIYIVFLWFLALGAVMFGESAQLPEFWRGAAFMFILLMALRQLSRLRDKGSIVRRVEEALGRWRHLVPAMRQVRE